MERARDIIADMELDRIDMIYSIDVIKGAETLIAGIDNIKAKSVSEAKTLVKSSAKRMKSRSHQRP